MQQNFEKTQELSSEMMQSFFASAYLHPHWQESQFELLSSLSKMLNEYSQTTLLPQDLKNLKDSGHWQIINLHRPQDFYHCLFQYYQQRFKDQGQIKILHQGDKLIVLKLFKNRHLEVIEHLPVFTILKGEIIPLTPVTHLHYNQDMELTSEKLHSIQLTDHIVARFSHTGSLWEGYFLRGYTFQKFNEFAFADLQQVLEVFHAIKRLEYLFVDMASDPTYQQLISQLEKTINFVETHDPASLILAKNTLTQAKNLRDNIFCNDKMLSLLITNLEYVSQKLQKQLHPTAEL